VRSGYRIFCGVVAVSGLAVAGCGGGGGVSTGISFDATTIPTETTDAPLTSDVLTTNGTGATTPGDVAPPATWRAASGNLEGLPSECGNLSYVWADPDRDMVVVGIALQGLWANEDGTDTWTQLGQGEGSDEITNRLTSIVRDPDQPDTFWQSGTYNGGGVYRTDDNGQTFQQLGDAFHSDLGGVDLSDPFRATLLTGVHEQSDLFLSDDGGQSWENISSALPEGVGCTTAPYVIDAETYLLGTNNGPEAGVYRTEDGGLTWVRVLDAPIVGAPLVHDDGAITWLLDRGGGTARSSDDGLTWATADSRGAIAPVANTLVEMPDGALVTIGNGSLVTSSDGGVNWFNLGPGLPYQPSGVTYAPTRDAFYLWRFDCNSDDNPIPPDAVMRWDVGGTP
jgi:photosystem II stability/assembly factor-like uncharacterized protein